MTPNRNRRKSAGDLLGVAVALVLPAGLEGCARPKPPIDLPRLFVSGPFDASADGAFAVDPDSKYATIESELRTHDRKLPRMDDRDFAMLAANRAMVRLALGDIEGARDDALDAQAVMAGEVRGEVGKAVAAALADEGAKVFKGEPYDMAMLNAIVGLCCLELGDWETAAVGFRRALEADKMSEEDARDDFLLAYWGLGMAHLDRDFEAASQAFARCRYKDAETVRDDNLVVIILLGNAPWKQLTGLYGEQDQFAGSFCEPAYAEVFADGVLLGRSTRLIDLNQQAAGIPRTGKDVGQGFKAGSKFALALAAGVFLGSSGADLVESAWSVKADTRTCHMLPNQIHVVSGRVAPGPHTINVRFYTNAGAHLRRYEQVWHYVVAPNSGKTYVNIRSEFDRCNVQGPVAFTRISHVRTRKLKPKKGTASDGGTEKPTEVVTVKFRAENLPGLRPGDTVTLCHSYGRTEHRMDDTYHWRQQPMAYDNKGQPIGHPGARFRMQDFDIGVVGQAKLTEIKRKTAIAKVVSLTSAYKPRPGDWVTATRKNGRLWK